MPKKTKVGYTNRGFDIARFTDQYGEKFSLQKSSLATEACLWFGPDDIRPLVMASEAANVGVSTSKTTGWVPYPIPANVHMNSRAHLSRNHVRQLIAYLQNWLRTGYLDNTKSLRRARRNNAKKRARR